MSEDPELSAIVVGAGPTGLAMAIELARQGVSFRLIDKADHPAQWSQALGVQARTLEQFERYGIAEKAVAAGNPTRHAAFYSDGKRIADAPIDRIPGDYPYVLILPQNDTERILTERLRSLGSAIERGVELTGFTNGEDSVNAHLRLKDGTTDIIQVRWLIGCDGAHSAVRRGLDVSFRGDTAGFSFLLADLALDGPNVPRDELRVYLRGGDVLAMIPMRDNLWRLIVADHSEKDNAERQPQLGDFQTAIDRCAGGGMTAHDAVWMAPFRVNQRKAEHYRMQSTFLAGDACHIHSPVGGQGMNTGIQDAANLGWKLGAVTRGADPKLPDSYDQERGAVGDALLRITSRGLAAATLSNPIAEALRDTALAVGSRVPFLRDAMAGWISETAISYNESPIVIDCGARADLIAGDRMPNADLSAGGRLLDLLREGKHLGIGAGVPEADRSELESKLPRASWIWVRPEEMPAAAKGHAGQILVVRPDGYIGFRGGAGDGGDLARYGKLAAL